MKIQLPVATVEPCSADEDKHWLSAAVDVVPLSLVFLLRVRHIIVIGDERGVPYTLQRSCFQDAAYDNCFPFLSSLSCF